MRPARREPAQIAPAPDGARPRRRGVRRRDDQRRASRRPRAPASTSCSRCSLLQAEVLELAGRSRRGARRASCSRRSSTRAAGPVATVLVQDGTLRRGDIVVVGTQLRPRARDGRRARRSASTRRGPSTPVQRHRPLGRARRGRRRCTSVENERVAKDIVDAPRVGAARGARRADAPAPHARGVLRRRPRAAARRSSSIVLKADTHGSAEALRDALLELSTDTVKVERAARGRRRGHRERRACSPRRASAIIVGFHVRPDPAARRAAEAAGRRDPHLPDHLRGRRRGAQGDGRPAAADGQREVRSAAPRCATTFNVPRIGTIAGCYVHRGHDAPRRRVPPAARRRPDLRGARSARSSASRTTCARCNSGFECGIGLEGFNDVKVGDVIEAYVLEEKPADARMVVGAARRRAARPRLPVAQGEARRDPLDRARACATSSTSRRRGRRAGHLAVGGARARGGGQRRARGARGARAGASSSSRSCTSPSADRPTSRCVELPRRRAARDEPSETDEDE